MDHRTISVGERLRRARVDRAVTILEAAAALHIRQDQIQALEADDYAHLPPGVYTRALIGKYARWLGLDASELLALHTRARPADKDVVRPAMSGMTKPPLVSLGAVATVVAILSFIGLFAYLRAQYNFLARSLELEGAVSPPALSTPTGRSIPGLLTPFPSPAPTSAETPLPSPTPILGVVVELRAVDRSWVQVWQDGSSALAETLVGGVERSFTGRRDVRIRVGNAGGVEVRVNGVSQPPLGARGQVVEAIWSRE